MYKTLFSLALVNGLALSTIALAQEPASSSGKIGSDAIFGQSGTMDPEPPGGMKAFQRWVAANYRVPKAARKAGVKGKVQITFIVEADGKLSGIRTVRDIGYGTGMAAVRLFRKSPRWTPGTLHGKPVRVAYTFPVTVGNPGRIRIVVPVDKETRK